MNTDCKNGAMQVINGGRTMERGVQKKIEKYIKEIKSHRTSKFDKIIEYWPAPQKLVQFESGRKIVYNIGTGQKGARWHGNISRQNRLSLP